MDFVKFARGACPGLRNKMWPSLVLFAFREIREYMAAVDGWHTVGVTLTIKRNGHGPLADAVVYLQALRTRVPEKDPPEEEPEVVQKAAVPGLTEEEASML